MSSYIDDWNNFTSHLHKWFYKPDIEGERIVLCTYLSHYRFNDPPVWLQIMGPPGSGKTAIGIDPLSSLANVYPVSSLSINSFLSGFGENNGVLKKFKKYSEQGLDSKYQGVLTFPDLTTTLFSEDPLTRMKIVGQMRRIYDGRFDKDVGNKNKSITWQGKTTCIAATTPETEDFWLTNQEMGERWIKIRWMTDNVDPEHYALAAIKQSGHEERIKNQLNNYIRNLIQKGLDHPGVDESNLSQHYPLLSSLANFVEVCRTTVRRERRGNKFPIIGLGTQQTPTRVAKNLISLVRASTSLSGSTEVTKEEIRLVARVAIDNIPPKRYLVVKNLKNLYPYLPTKYELMRLLLFPRTTFYRLIEDLVYLGIIEEVEDKITTSNTSIADLDSQDSFLVKQKIKLSDSFLSTLRKCQMVSGRSA